MQFPIIPCNLCGSQENLQRQAIKAMLQGWEKEQPGRLENIFRSIQNVAPSQLGDLDLFNFTDLEQQREAPTGETEAWKDDMQQPALAR
jgi:tRNA 2-thiocytidine biosynthesis protein TtcA